MKTTTYKILRFYFKASPQTVKRGLTLEQAQEHCADPETSSRTATNAAATQRTEDHGAWFEGYTEE